MAEWILVSRRLLFAAIVLCKQILWGDVPMELGETPTVILIMISRSFGPRERIMWIYICRSRMWVVRAGKDVSHELLHRNAHIQSTPSINLVVLQWVWLRSHKYKSRRDHRKPGACSHLAQHRESGACSGRCCLPM